MPYAIIKLDGDVSELTGSSIVPYLYVLDAVGCIEEGDGSGAGDAVANEYDYVSGLEKYCQNSQIMLKFLKSNNTASHSSMSYNNCSNYGNYGNSSSSSYSSTVLRNSSPGYYTTNYGNTNTEVTYVLRDARTFIERVRAFIDENSSDVDDDDEERYDARYYDGNMSASSNVLDGVLSINKKNFKFKNVHSIADCDAFETTLQQFENAVSSKHAHATTIPRDVYKNGVTVVINYNMSVENIHSGTYSTYSANKHNDRPCGLSSIMRLPGDTTVRGLRAAISRHLEHYLKDGSLSAEASSAEASMEYSIKDVINATVLKCKRLNDHTSVNQTFDVNIVLGNDKLVLRKESADDSVDSGKEGEEDKEDAEIGSLVGDKCLVNVSWNKELSRAVDGLIDMDRWGEVTDLTSSDVDGGGSNNKGMSDPEAITLQDCLRKFSEKEQLAQTESWYCNKCKDHVRAYKEMSVWRAPPYLIIQLKRFSFRNNSHYREKIDNVVEFPLTDFDMSEFVISKQKSAVTGEYVPPIYDCYAVSNHFGGLGGGHYTAFAKDGDKWYNFDDSRVTEVTSERDVVSKAAYCLYYRRKDLREDDVDFLEQFQRMMKAEGTGVAGGKREEQQQNEDEEMDVDDSATTSSSATTTPPVQSMVLGDD
jgi:hypothetical protein